MAEFQDVIKHWGRMLDAHRHGESIAIEASVPADAFKDAKLVEEIVMSWAAEHPEPVYPTWLEWLEKMGIMADIHDRLNNYKQVMEVCGKPLYSIPTTKVFCPIPADIAKKLGIEPKEG